MSYSSENLTRVNSYDSRTLPSLIQAINSTSFGIIVTDPKQQDNPIVFVNEGFTRLSGYDQSEILGKNFRFLGGSDTSQPQLQEIKEAIENRENITVVLRNYRKDGTLFWNELTISPVFDQDGDLINFVGIQNDVTERMKSHAQAMSEDFMAILSHELKIPLLGVQMILEKLTEPSMQDAPIRSYKDFLESAKQSNKSLIKLIDKLSKVYQTTRGDSIEMEACLSFKSIVEQCLDSLKTLIYSKNLTVDIDGLEDCLIKNRGSKLSKAIFAILSNALNYTSDNGRVTVKSKLNDSKLVITISDDGPGLPDAIKEKLFIGFSTRSKNDIVPVKVGVGLYHAHKLTAESGGNIKLVEGSGGKGSTFEIVWPN